MGFLAEYFVQARLGHLMLDCPKDFRPAWNICVHVWLLGFFSFFGKIPKNTRFCLARVLFSI